MYNWDCSRICLCQDRLRSSDWTNSCFLKFFDLLFSRCVINLKAKLLKINSGEEVTIEICYKSHLKNHKSSFKNCSFENFKKLWKINQWKHIEFYLIYLETNASERQHWREIELKGSVQLAFCINNKLIITFTNNCIQVYQLG